MKKRMHALRGTRPKEIMHVTFPYELFACRRTQLCIEMRAWNTLRLFNVQAFIQTSKLKS